MAEIDWANAPTPATVARIWRGMTKNNRKGLNSIYNVELTPHAMIATINIASGVGTADDVATAEAWAMAEYLKTGDRQQYTLLTAALKQLSPYA